MSLSTVRILWNLLGICFESFFYRTPHLRNNCNSNNIFNEISNSVSIFLLSLLVVAHMLRRRLFFRCFVVYHIIREIFFELPAVCSISLSFGFCLSPTLSVSDEYCACIAFVSPPPLPSGVRRGPIPPPPPSSITSPPPLDVLLYILYTERIPSGIETLPLWDTLFSDEKKRRILQQE